MYFIFCACACVYAVRQCVRDFRAVECENRFFYVTLVYVYMITFFAHVRILNNVVCFLCIMFLFESRQKTTKNVFVCLL